MAFDLESFRKESKYEFANNEKIKNRIKKIKPPELDKKFEKNHDQVFKELDCLTCANCCKTTSPIFLQTDIDRLEKSLKMKISAFIDSFLHRDEEGDFVLNSSPCIFLSTDNTCQVYENRPKACRAYPHTNRRKMHAILDLTLKNTLVCPAVFKIFTQISKDFRK